MLASTGVEPNATAYPADMDPVVVLFLGSIVLIAVFAFLLSWHPRRGRRLVGELRRGPDYEAIAQTEEHDVDQMLDAIAERRRRTGRRDIGEELADELTRGTWDDR
jgi:hypothetical protein